MRFFFNKARDFLSRHGEPTQGDTYTGVHAKSVLDSVSITRLSNNAFSSFHRIFHFSYGNASRVHVKKIPRGDKEKLSGMRKKKRKREGGRVKGKREKEKNESYVVRLFFTYTQHSYRTHLTRTQADILFLEGYTRAQGLWGQGAPGRVVWNDIYIIYSYGTRTRYRTLRRKSFDLSF